MKTVCVTSHFSGAVSKLFEHNCDIVARHYYETDLKSEFYDPDIEVVKKADLVVFTGGEDINPKLYGESNRYSGFNDDRDTAEIEVFQWCLELNKKMLGICRGHQLLNALTGGHLVQDLYHDLHQTHGGNHAIEDMVSGSQWIVPNSFITVNSMHHQGVIEPGRGLTPTSWFRGVFESCESDNIITVQFHPEFMIGMQPQVFADKITEWVMKGQ